MDYHGLLVKSNVSLQKCGKIHKQDIYFSNIVRDTLYGNRNPQIGGK